MRSKLDSHVHTRRGPPRSWYRRGRPNSYDDIAREAMRADHPGLSDRQINNLLSAQHAAQVLELHRRNEFTWFRGRTRVLSVLGSILRQSKAGVHNGHDAVLIMARTLLNSIQSGEELSTAEGERRLRALWRYVGEVSIGRLLTKKQRKPRASSPASTS